MQTTRVTIDLDVGSDPISGQLDVAGRPTETFVGWSALAEILEEARAGLLGSGARTVPPETPNARGERQ
jgi:hypothetical protein